MRRSRRLPVLTALAVALVGVGVSACGTEQIELAADDPDRRGAELFNERCAGCHTLSVSGSQGSATDVRDRERVDGPNFNQRKEDYASVVYAIQNGGFSGAIMPANLTTGEETKQVARFLAKYSGSEAARAEGSPQPANAPQRAPGARE